MPWNSPSMSIRSCCSPATAISARWSKRCSAAGPPFPTHPPMIADEWRRQSDVFTDLVELQSKLGRDPSERPAPREPRHHAPQFLQRATTMAPRGDDDDFDD